MSKDDAINFHSFLSYIKMSESADLTYYQRNRDVILNRSKDYYENDKDRLRGQARDKNRKLSEEEKNTKREYRKNRYHNMSEEKTKTKRIAKKLSRG